MILFQLLFETVKNEKTCLKIQNLKFMLFQAANCPLPQPTSRSTTVIVISPAPHAPRANSLVIGVWSLMNVLLESLQRISVANNTLSMAWMWVFDFFLKVEKISDIDWSSFRFLKNIFNYKSFFSELKKNFKF